MANNAVEDLRDKMILEVQFQNELMAYFSRVVNRFSELYSNRLPIDVTSFDPELTTILMNQYDRVIKVFGNRIRRDLPQDIQSTVEEDRAIADALKRFSEIRASIQANNINRTTQQNVVRAISQAESFDTERDELIDGRVVRVKQRLVGFELVRTASQILVRQLTGRSEGIITNETQVPAEAAKLTEAEILSFVEPSVSGGDTRELRVNKVWVSVGDDLVRDSHLEADGQQVGANLPFIVGGFQLMTPGDTSRGAPLTETAGCRCAAVYDEQDVITIRYDRELEEQIIFRG